MYSNFFTREWKEYPEIEKSFIRNFILGEQQSETDSSSLFFALNCGEKNMEEKSYPYFNINLDKIDSGFDNFSQIFEPKSTNIFKVIYKERNSLFTNIEDNEIDSSTNDETFLKRKKGFKKKRRFENQDNIRKKIKRGFLNKALIIKINNILNDNKIRLYLERFPQKLVCDITKKSNKSLLNMSLEHIFEIKELYDENDLNNYYHNLKVIKSKEVQENFELKAILNKTYSELFEEYLNSKEFKVDEINRLKENKMENSYIERYIYLAKHLIEFFSD